jgi:hypothetical protein
MAVNMNMTVLWDTVHCSIVEVDRRSQGVFCLYNWGDWGSKHLWNVGQLRRDYTEQYASILSSSVPENSWSCLPQGYVSM